MKVRIWLASVAAVLLALLVFHSAILGGLGAYLVEDDPPQKSDIAVALAGDFSGQRITTAAQLVREGYAPRVVVSGPAGIYGRFECDLAIPFALAHGYPVTYFIAMPHYSHSTQEEARAIVPELRKMGAKTVLLVTSNYHTRRAGGIFRAAAPDLTFNVAGAPDEYFSAHGWWHSREGRKTFMFEWMKTMAEWVGL